MLIQAIIMTALIGIMSTAVMSSISGFQKETAHLQNVLTSMEVKQTLILATSNMDICDASMSLPTPLTFDPTTLSTRTPVKLPLTELFQDPARTQSLLKMGKFSATTPVEISDISVELTDRTGNIYNGELKVRFDNSKLQRALAPVTAKIRINAPLSGSGLAEVSGCLASTGGSATIDYGSCITIYHSQDIEGVHPHCGTTEYIHKVGECPAGYVSVGGSTGVRFPRFCQVAHIKCCPLG